MAIITIGKEKKEITFNPHLLHIILLSVSMQKMMYYGLLLRKDVSRGEMMK